MPAPQASTPGPRPSLIGMDLDGLREATVASGAHPLPFAASQLAGWLYGKGCTDLDGMTNLSKELRAGLAERFTTLTSTVTAREESGEGATIKLAVRLHDGPIIECVLMTEDRNTACISTQAGCAMGCRFCASGLLGLSRNLTAGEILEQVLHLRALLDPGQALTNIVVMGVGEPLHNFDALATALRILNADWGFNLGARRITVSTVGLPQRIRDLADLDVPVNLAVSLHATTDEQRSALIPTNAGLANILEAARYYFERTRREVTLEYTLVAGWNDSAANASELVALLASQPRANVNLIPMNPVEGTDLAAPTHHRVEEFTSILRAAGLNVHIRKRRGRAVQAACGQLRLRLEGGSGDGR